MKNKVKLLAGVSFVMLTVAAVCYTTSQCRTTDPWLEMNIDALTDGELDPIATCNYYCTDDPEYDCVLTTIFGFDMTCHLMKPCTR